MKLGSQKSKEGRFWASLFDFSFKHFVTVRIFVVIYGVNIILAGVLGVLTIIGGFQESTGLGILAVIVVPLLFLIYILFLRIILEAIAVLFHIGDHVKAIAEHLESGTKRIEEYEVSEPKE